MDLGIFYGWVYESENWHWVYPLAGHMRVKYGLGYVLWLGI